MHEARRKGLLSEDPLDRKSAKQIVDKLLAANWRDFCPDVEHILNITVSHDVISLYDLITVYPQVTHGLYPVHYNPNLSPNPSPFHIKGLPLYWLHRERKLRRGIVWIAATII